MVGNARGCKGPIRVGIGPRSKFGGVNLGDCWGSGNSIFAIGAANVRARVEATWCVVDTGGDPWWQVRALCPEASSFGSVYAEKSRVVCVHLRRGGRR